MATFKSTSRYETITMTQKSFFPGSYSIPPGDGHYSIVKVENILDKEGFWLPPDLNFPAQLSPTGAADRNVHQKMGGYQNYSQIEVGDTDPLSENIRDMANPAHSGFSYHEWSGEDVPGQGVTFPPTLGAIIRYWELVQ